jgi:transcriptional regulator with XRE-family HTH domain
MQDTFADYFQRLRLRQNLSLREVARRAGIVQSTLSRWEQGRYQPRLPELRTVLHVLGADAAQEQQAIALLDAPRAIQHVRQIEEQAPSDWAEAAGALPAAGDLLRAMRLRRGWTQAQVASALGVAQGRVARWERSEDRPSQERLHALCYALGASGEELVVLASGRLRMGHPSPEEDWEAYARTCLSALWEAPEELLDLTALAGAAHLWPLAARHEEARFSLTYTYCVYAHRLAEATRWKETNDYAWRALELTRQGWLDGYSDHVLAILAAASAVDQGETPRHLRQAMQTLSSWIDSVEYAVHRGLLLSRMGTYLARSGQEEEALRLCRDACRLTAQVDTPWDLLLRKRDYAETLARTGRYEQALEVLEQTVALADREEAMRAVYLLDRAHCLLGLEQAEQAWEQFCTAQELVNAHRLRFLEPHMREVRRGLGL